MSSTYFNISDKLRLYEFDGMLDQYGDAAAAYSLRKLRSGYTGDAIRVRRSSDDVERDMGFYDNELDTVTLLDWVNAEYVTYESNFVSGGDSYSILQMVQTLSESIAGENDAAKFRLISGNGNHYAYRGSGAIKVGQTMKVTGRYYIPSTNVSCNAIRVSGGSNEFEFFNALDQWAEFEIITTATLTYAIFRAANGTNLTLDGDDDVFYLKDVVYTQLTADGHVHTWYDQSANANHAVQGTDTAQPKIVDAGSLVVENGKPTIAFDGVDDSLKATYTELSGEDVPHSAFLVSKPNQTDQYNTSFNFGRTGNGANLYDITYATLGRYSFLKRDDSYLIKSYNSASSVYTVAQQLRSFINTGTVLNDYLNSGIVGTNVDVDTGNSDYTYMTIGARGFASAIDQYLNGNIQEILSYSSNKSSIRTDIEFNINKHYNIY